MADHDTQTRDRDQWKARILRALAELRHEPPHVGGGASSRDDAPSSDGAHAHATARR